MYFPVLKKAIQNLEEKAFYDVALMYLGQLGYRELRIVDGSGDGGRDVTCSRDDLRIQLSVRRDWERKINDEATTTRQKGKRHLIYLTNRIITPEAEQDFLSTRYIQKGEVDLTIVDLNLIATTLARPGVIRKAYEMLGMSVPVELKAEPRDIAISTVLLFSPEARELRDEIIEANLRAQLLQSPNLPEDLLVQRVADAIPGTNVARAATSALARLRSVGRIQGGPGGVRLSEPEYEVMRAAEIEFLTARRADIQMLAGITRLDETRATQLLDLALELLVRDRALDGSGPIEQSLRGFLATHQLGSKSTAIFETLARTASARMRQYGATVDQIFSTNSFDIYRALGRRTNLSVVLDASVAMPVLFGLSFGSAKSRYGVSALALKTACEGHNIRLVVPRVYLNEMAAHGQRALEMLDVYNVLPDEARQALRASENAYLSHYTHVAESLVRDGGDALGLKGFLDFFGVRRGASLQSIENRIQTLLDQHSIKILPSAFYDQEIRKQIIAEKPYESKFIVDHDAIVATMLKNDDEKGFILATWDRVMINIVEELARVYADTPARVIDFLSMARGNNFETDQSYDLLTTLLHVNERIAERLARRIEQIKSVEQAYKLDHFIREARQREGDKWRLLADHVAPFIDEPSQVTDV